VPLGGQWRSAIGSPSTATSAQPQASAPIGRAHRDRRTVPDIMETRVKLLGHPVHPMLIVLPLGLLSVAVLGDFAYLITGDGTFAEVAFWTMTVGIAGGFLAAVFGLIDWLSIPGGTRAKRVGLWHGIGNVVVIAVFAVSWYLRVPEHAYSPDIAPFLVALVGLAGALVTSWLGGELVYRLGVGVDAGANVDAPSSLATNDVRASRPAGTARTAR
jgi:uncharacterized membrane protein